jgi:hypothetical protein
LSLVQCQEKFAKIEKPNSQKATCALQSWQTSVLKNHYLTLKIACYQVELMESNFELLNQAPNYNNALGPYVQPRNRK